MTTATMTMEFQPGQVVVVNSAVDGVYEATVVRMEEGGKVLIQAPEHIRAKHPGSTGRMLFPGHRVSAKGAEDTKPPQSIIPQPEANASINPPTPVGGTPPEKGGTPPESGGRTWTCRHCQAVVPVPEGEPLVRVSQTHNGRCPNITHPGRPRKTIVKQARKIRAAKGDKPLDSDHSPDVSNMVPDITAVPESDTRPVADALGPTLAAVTEVLRGQRASLVELMAEAEAEIARLTAALPRMRETLEAFDRVLAYEAAAGGPHGDQ